MLACHHKYQSVNGGDSTKGASLAGPSLQANFCSVHHPLSQQISNFLPFLYHYIEILNLRTLWKHKVNSIANRPDKKHNVHMPNNKEHTVEVASK